MRVQNCYVTIAEGRDIHLEVARLLPGCHVYACGNLPESSKPLWLITAPLGSRFGDSQVPMLRAIEFDGVMTFHLLDEFHYPDYQEVGS